METQFECQVKNEGNRPGQSSDCFHFLLSGRVGCCNFLPMEYISTRGSAPPISSKRAIIKGLAEDGGLYVPSVFPSIGPDPFSGPNLNSYAAKAARILKAFLTDYSDNELDSAGRAAYADNFDPPAIAPVKFLDEGIAVL